MSHHGFKLNFAVDHELLTIFIETLTGSTFEIVVTPIDSIASIKAKIQRMEGVLVSQQHLLYNLQELDDQSTVQDYGIQDGSTIKLVLSMRGGPLGTARRILPLDDVVVKEFVDLDRSEIEDLPPGSKLAIIVFRDDDSVNMFRVLENTDGSFSPLSSSTSSSSTSKNGDPTQATSSNVGKTLIDSSNLKTQNKMQELRQKMQALSIQKKSENTKEKVNVESSTPHLPPIKTTSSSDTSKNIETGDKSTACAIPPSQVPVLPHITPQYGVEQRPRTAPSSKLTGEQICQILSDAGKHRTQLLSSHCTTSSINRLSQSSTSDMLEYDSTSWSRGSSSGSGGKQGSLALYSTGPSRSLLNPLLSENNTSILAKKLPVNEYKVVKPTTSSMYKLSPITSTSSKSHVAKSSEKGGNVAKSSSGEGGHIAKSSAESLSKTKKKPSTRSRCAECNKKLNISAVYSCRCEKLFCSKHRYSETHACTYDYKKEGRKVIADANPLVTAPKITKF